MATTIKRTRSTRRPATAPFVCHVVANGVELGPRQQALIRREAGKLGQFFDRILEARVVVTSPHRRLHRESVEYVVRIYLTVPRGELVVKRQRHAEFRTAIQEAFRAAGRVLQDHAVRLRSPLVERAGAASGRVARIFPYEGFGFLTGDDGTDLYFHRNAVVGVPFEAIEVGDRVRYAESEGDQGPQASMVARAGRGSH